MAKIIGRSTLVAEIFLNCFLDLGFFINAFLFIDIILLISYWLRSLDFYLDLLMNNLFVLMISLVYEANTLKSLILF